MKALIFDLDGTLVDSVYAHVLAFQKAFAEAGLLVESWRIHRHIGMSGDLLTHAVTRDSGRKVPARKLREIDERHGEILAKLLPQPPPLPGAIELLRDLNTRGIPYGIATSGEPKNMKSVARNLKLKPGTVVVTRSDAAEGKPEPDLFLECQKRLAVPPHECYVVGDAIWDVLASRRSGMLALALRTGGYSQEELTGAGAYRVFANPEELRQRLDDLGLTR